MAGRRSSDADDRKGAGILVRDIPCCQGLTPLNAAGLGSTDSERVRRIFMPKGLRSCMLSTYDFH